MEKKNLIKKGLAIVLSAAMVLGIMPSIGDNLKEVQAATTNTAPTPGYWTDAAGLEKFSLDAADDTVGKIIFGQNGSGAAQQWKIAGTDTGISGDNIILFADTPLGTSVFASDTSNRTFSYDGVDTEVYSNHYGASDLRGVLQGYASNLNYFSSAEQRKMNDTTIYTNDAQNSANYTTTDKLYAPYGDITSGNDSYVTVGTNDSDNLNGRVKINISKWGDALFWLRSPYRNNSSRALVACPGIDVDYFYVRNYDVSVVPAFNLNLSSVLFASAAEAASSTGYVEKASMTENTYTLRYLSGGSETAVVNAAGSSIAITGATDTMYLVAQNNTGAYAKKLTSSTTSVSANDIDGLDNFNNCKVWLESTDDDRITTAKMATQETASVTITADATMTKTSESGAESQTGITGDMAEVVYTANSGYYFPSDYSVTPVNGISVTRLSASQIKVSGAPTAVSVEITLSAATEKGTADTPEIGINYSDETLTGFDTTKKYSINGGTEFTPTASTIAIEDSYFGNTITIKETASDTANESAEKEVVIPARPAAPSVTPNNENVTGKGDGSITGVDSTMEYHSTDQTNWNDCTGTTIPNLTSGTYYVRIAATNTSFKSSPATVVIGSNAEKKIALAVTAPLFATVTEGYTRPEAKDITIANDTTNGANWDATVSGVTLTGTDAESFAVSGSGNTWTVQPKAGLTANTDGTAKTYTATINVAYDATAGVTSPATADVSFTVNPKSNTVTVTNGTGSATYNKGEAVTAIANTASTGYIFTGWTGIDGLTLLEGTTATSETIKFTMPEGAVGITANYKDNAAPTATIKVKNNTWSQIFNTITFGYFFKDTQTVTITGTDNESGVRRIEYSLKNAEVLDLSTITDWTDYNNTPFSIDPSRKYVIYARVTDNADHTTIVNSKGIVVYQDATADTTSIQYVKAAPSDKTAKVNLNGNTVKEIKNGATTIDATNYSVAADGTITFKSNYLDTLAVADSPYTLTISYNPLGESWVADVNNDEPATTTLNVTVVNSIAPVITSGPANATVIEGNTATFTVVATGTPAPTYQWQVNKGTTWEDITTATSASYTTSATTLENSGYQYQCVVKNGEESSDRVVSNAATLTVTDPSVTPSITTHPANATVIEGNTATFTVAATGTPAPTYQWQINKGTTWENINDAQSASYTTSETVKANDGYKYRCVVTNRKGSVTSNEATLTVTDKPVTTYTITVASDNNGTAFANITTATSGTKVTLTATPKDGYQFKEWQVLEGGVTITSNEFTMPASNVSVKAIFEKKASGDDNNKPTGPSLGDGIKGWSDIKDKIQDEIKDATEKVTITIDMGGETKVPGDVIESIKGKDVDVVFDLGNGIKWTVNGKDVTGTNIGEIDFGVTTGTSTIPVDVVNEVTGERYSIQISLAYNGEFGFTATLSINMDAKNAGYYANLYYYNKSTGKLEFMNAGKIDGEGNVELTFTHASDYTIVVSDKAMNETETPTPETPSTTPTETDSPKTGDTSPILLWVLVLIGSGIGVTAVASKKRKRETK